MKKADIVGILSLLIAIVTLIFGDNIYQQMKGRSVFETEIVPTRMPTSTFVPTSQPVIPSPTVEKETFAWTATPAPSPTKIPQFIPTIFPTSDIPNTYTFQVGEFPYCIARRFDVDPAQLLALNGLSSANANTYLSGRVFMLPQSGTFPGNRTLTSHPAQYTVTSSDETIFGIACKYGDVFPEDIASLNGMPVTSSLERGQVLQIP